MSPHIRFVLGHQDFGHEGRRIELPFYPPKGALIYIEDHKSKEYVAYKVIDHSLKIIDYGEFLNYHFTRLLLERLTPYPPKKG